MYQSNQGIKYLDQGTLRLGLVMKSMVKRGYLSIRLLQVVRRLGDPGNSYTSSKEFDVFGVLCVSDPGDIISSHFQVLALLKFHPPPPPPPPPPESVFSL